MQDHNVTETIAYMHLLTDSGREVYSTVSKNPKLYKIYISYYATLHP